MKVAGFDNGHIGIVCGDEIVDVTDLGSVPPGSWPPIGMVKFIAAFEEIRHMLQRAVDTGTRHPLSSVRLECPIKWPNKVIAFPANYHDHVEEMKRTAASASSYNASGQGFFLKANSSLSGPDEPIVLPKLSGRQIHHECELAVIIGQSGREISLANAMEHVFGYSCLMDIVVRGKEERVMRKSYDTFCPVGPYIVTRDEVPDHTNIALKLEVNGEIRQKANTRDLIVDIPNMIHMASSVMTLYPGDIIASGTPAGVGVLSGGDSVVISIAAVGSMSLRVVQSEGGYHKVWNKPAAIV